MLHQSFRADTDIKEIIQLTAHVPMHTKKADRTWDLCGPQVVLLYDQFVGVNLDIVTYSRPVHNLKRPHSFGLILKGLCPSPKTWTHCR